MLFMDVMGKKLIVAKILFHLLPFAFLMAVISLFSVRRDEPNSCLHLCGTWVQDLFTFAHIKVMRM